MNFFQKDRNYGDTLRHTDVPNKQPVNGWNINLELSQQTAQNTFVI
ncbi:hypothetical protein N9061_00220 [bacterium]|nr:hypothetical protein [bacterium]MDB4483545.1 hypothetical protein [bacterium]MDC3224233.1 hypothetical protein [Mariniblastus sp.]